MALCTVPEEVPLSAFPLNSLPASPSQSSVIPQPSGPISVLPPEILQYIFSCLVLEYQEDWTSALFDPESLLERMGFRVNTRFADALGLDYRRQNDWKRILCVSKYWRDTALSTPSLWCYVDGFSRESFQDCSTYSGMAPLTMVYCPISFSSYQNELKSLKSHEVLQLLPRVERLAVHTELSEGHVDLTRGHFLDPLCNDHGGSLSASLRHLHLSIKGASSTFDSALLLSRFTSLRTFGLFIARGNIGPFSLPTSLTSLSLHAGDESSTSGVGPEIDLWAILSSLPQLLELRVVGCFPDPITTPQHTLELPVLRVLQLKNASLSVIENFIRFLSYPPLTHLVVHPLGFFARDIHTDPLEELQATLSWMCQDMEDYADLVEDSVHLEITPGTFGAKWHRRWNDTSENMNLELRLQAQDFTFDRRLDLIQPFVSTVLSIHVRSLHVTFISRRTTGSHWLQLFQANGFALSAPVTVFSIQTPELDPLLSILGTPLEANNTAVRSQLLFPSLTQLEIRNAPFYTSRVVDDPGDGLVKMVERRVEYGAVAPKIILKSCTVLKQATKDKLSQSNIVLEEVEPLKRVWIPDFPTV